MESIIICFAAFASSMLTLFSGFGLGMLLMAVLSLFYPVEIAIAMTAVVHFMNNVLKLFLFRPYINKHITLYFGLSAFLFSYLGAESLSLMKSVDLNFFNSNLLNVLIAVILLFFAFFKPKVESENSKAAFLIKGGILSGFFGGFAGQQGAIRTAFLINLGLNKNTFIATGVSIAIFIDIVRIGIYMKNDVLDPVLTEKTTIIAAVISAYLGISLGKKFFDKIELKWIHLIVKTMIVLVSVFLILGIKLK